MIFMPVTSPPNSGPLGRSRSRISASGYSTWSRCPKQWFLTRKVGLSSPTSVFQILGVVVEDGLIDLLMHRPDNFSSFEELHNWAKQKIPGIASKWFNIGLENWQNTTWRKEGLEFEELGVNSIEIRIENGLDLFLGYVKVCHDENGGPLIDLFRQRKIPFEIPSPCHNELPHYPLPDRIPLQDKISKIDSKQVTWNDLGSPASWQECWEVCRPWMKDIRITQPQRMYHKDGWAAGELDVVMRWDGEIRLIDIKSGDGSGPFSISLQNQLQFYDWLWSESFSSKAKMLAGWYLASGEEKIVDVLQIDELQSFGQNLKQIHYEMLSSGEGYYSFENTSLECNESAGCSWCAVSKSEEGWMNEEILSGILPSLDIEISTPCHEISEIQSRVNVKGRFKGSWGPLPNSFNEPVNGGVLLSGQTIIPIEESELGDVIDLHSYEEKDVVILNALSGSSKGKPKLYLDKLTEIHTDELGADFTRLGMLRSRANIEGYVIATRYQKGTRIDTSPFTMFTFHVFDGKSVIEAVAFGTMITDSLINMRIGTKIRIIGAEISWRGGMAQLRLNQRSTRINLEVPENQS